MQTSQATQSVSILSQTRLSSKTITDVVVTIHGPLVVKLKLAFVALVILLATFASINMQLRTDGTPQGCGMITCKP
jgi:hypothetical protein